MQRSSFARLDDSPDDAFYAVPRLVHHIDDRARAAVTALYRERFAPGTELLDVMSSWVSHLPQDVTFGSVTGLGMNAEELAANPQLTSAVVHDLNRDPLLPFEDARFDGAAICVSIQYLTQPVAVLRELARVLRPAAPLVITFSNRRFPTKAVSIWSETDDAGHVALVDRYLRESGWSEIEASRRTRYGWGDPLYAVTALRT